ncbi:MULTISPECIES: hypothetical protein [unclassified Saccharothrix]|uniref:hypothetical protein n=1 Tax=unclassified Saccharothrix TaxID=2593673 RepID=UPI00307E574B
MMGVGAFGRVAVAAGLVVGSGVAVGPGAVAADGPSAWKAVIDEKVTKDADGYTFTGTVACPEQESPIDITKVVLIVRQEGAVGKADGDKVECQDGSSRADGKWKVLLKSEQEQSRRNPPDDSPGMKPGKAEAYVVVVQGTTFEMGKGSVTLPE